MKVLDIDGLNYYDGKIKQTYATKSYVDTQDALKAPLASPALTGTPTSQTPSTDDNSTKIATTAYVKSNLGNYATLNGATFTGAVNGVTPTAGDDSTKLATTAYVQGELSNFTPSGSFLPLAGGTMSGNIVYEGLDEDEFLIGRTEGDGSRDIGWFKNNENVGANIALRSSEYGDEYGQAGEFVIIAKNGSNLKALNGKPDGTLTWVGKKIATFDSNNKLVFPDGTTVWIS